MAAAIYRRMFRQKASTMYKMMGDPRVSSVVYIKYWRMRLVAIPIRFPIAAQTPKAFHSTKLFNLSMTLR